MVSWTGYADLTFDGSAGLALERAAERAATDVHAIHADAWIVEDRGIAFQFEGETSAPALEATKRLLSALVLLAQRGEVAIELLASHERWGRRASPPSDSGEIVIGEAYVGPSETIPTGILDVG